MEPLINAIINGWGTCLQAEIYMAETQGQSAMDLRGGCIKEPMQWRKELLRVVADFINAYISARQAQTLYGGYAGNRSASDA
jgi:hypothetical protein